MARAEITTPDVHATEVDGIPAYWAPMDGPVTAVLQFDGGICLEPPHQRGIQHLIEHLALAAVPPQPYDYNGFVDLRRMAFTVRGEPDEVRAFFDVVSPALNAIPDDRHHLEPHVLRAEAERNAGSTLTNLLTYLFGAAGPGVASLPELAVGTATAEDLASWTATHVHTGRASLFCSADPAFLDLSAVPRGDRGPAWTLPPTIDGPGWIFGNASGFAAVAILPRSTATSTMVRILRDHLLDVVRHRDGVSYAVETTYEPITATDTIVALYVDASPDKRVAARNTLLDGLDRFAEEGPEESWLELDANRLARINRETTAGVSLAARAAAGRLLGEEQPLDNTWLEEYHALTPADLAEVGGTFLQAASWQMAGEAPMPPWRNLRRLRLFSESAVQGDELPPKGQPGYRMIAGRDGLSIVSGPERLGTVLFTETVAVEAWDDGARLLYGRDGTRILFDPGEWSVAADFGAWLDGRLAAAPILRRSGARPR